MWRVALLLVACGGSEPAAKPVVEAPAAKPAAAPAAPAAARKVAITLGAAGLDPARIEANPGESITLVLERPADGGCGAELTGLPAPAPVPAGGRLEVTVQAPAAGELALGCGAQKGAVVVAGR